MYSRYRRRYTYTSPYTVSSHIQCVDMRPLYSEVLRDSPDRNRFDMPGAPVLVTIYHFSWGLLIRG